MRTILPDAEAGAAPIASSLSSPAATPAARLFDAAQRLLPLLEDGTPFDTGQLRIAMTSAYGQTDAEGAWDWKMAYDACEAAQVLLLRRYGRALAARGRAPQRQLAMWQRIAARVPTQTRRSEEGQSFQQFSTPLPLAFVAAFAAAIRPGDCVLEPSAGTGMLAVHAGLAGATLALNEFAELRAGLLELLFAPTLVSRHDAAAIDDRLDPGVAPDVVLINPPFSSLVNVDRKMKGAALRHIASALARLKDGGRLVAIVGAGCSPEAPAWRGAFIRLQESATLRFSAAIAGKVFARHGTTIPTRLIVIDKVPAGDPAQLPQSRGEAPDLATLLQWVEEDLPPRPAPPALPVAPATAVQARATANVDDACARASAKAAPPGDAGVELGYETLDWVPPEGQLGDTIYEPYALQSLVHSRGAAASHRARPVGRDGIGRAPQACPTARICRRGSSADGVLSDAQLESIIYAGEAHMAGMPLGCVDGRCHLGPSSAPRPTTRQGAVQFRRGWFLGDGTGAGKGRQVAGIILDNYAEGPPPRALDLEVGQAARRRAARLVGAGAGEIARHAAVALPAGGTSVKLGEGHLCSPPTRRCARRGAKGRRAGSSRSSIGSGRDFDGVIIFDEAHAMANAAGGKGERGDQKPSQQGRAGLRLQHALAEARIVYVSATGATTVQNLAYAQRLGLWGGSDFPFASRADFVAAIEDGGVAAMEVLARDLKALGLYAARSLSFDGVEYELLEHSADGRAAAHLRQLCRRLPGHPQQSRRRDGSGGGDERPEHGTLNGQAKSAARSAFESTKQRFLQPSDHRDADAERGREHRARSRGGPCGGRPDRLDRRGAAGAAAGRDPRGRVERRVGRHHAARICARLSGVELSGAALRALQRRRRQSVVAAGL
jgi:predicted RNA methylase